MIATVVRKTEKLSYEFLPDGDIHQITFHDASRAAYNEFIDVMDEIYQDVTEDDTLRILIDYRESGIPNVTYTFRKGLRWANSLSVHPEARMAIVTGREFILHVFSSLISTVRFSHLSTRFFEDAKGYDKALEWLQRE